MYAKPSPSMIAHRKRMREQREIDARQLRAAMAAAIYAAPRPVIDANGRRRDARTGRFLKAR